MNNFNTVVGDHMMISNYIRYERLTELINVEFCNSGYNEINLYIDAYSMIKSIYGLSPSQFIDKYSIASFGLDIELLVRYGWYFLEWIEA